MLLNGRIPEAHLREVKNIADVDKISGRDLLEYLRGYKVYFDLNESPASLRSKLKDTLGLSSAYHLGFEFHDT